MPAPRPRKPAAKTPKKTNPDAVIHAVLGSDSGRVGQIARELAARLTPEGGDEFAQDIVDGGADNADDAAAKIYQAVQSLETLPFFGSKLVWLKGANFLGDTPSGRSETVKAALEKLATTLETGLPNGVRFLLSGTDIDKRRTFYKTLDKLGELQLFDNIDTSKSGWEGGFAAAAAARARELGFRFEPDAIELFCLLCGTESRQLENELQKVDLFLGPSRRTATVEDVRRVVPSTQDGVIWAIGNAFAARKPGQTLQLIDQFLGRGESAIGILLVAIIPTVRNLLYVKDLMVRHNLRPPQQPWFFKSTLDRLPIEATRHLPRKKDGEINAFQLGIAASSAAKFKLPELVRALEYCLQANLELVTTQLDPQVVLNKLAIRILGE